MENIVLLSVMAFLTGCIGMSIGGLAGKGIYHLYQHKVEELYAMCGGMLIGVILLELLPESLATYGNIPITLGALLGVLVLVGMENVLAIYSEADGPHFWSSIILLVVAIAIHNIPAGISLGTTFSTNDLGLTLLATLFVHHIPEGMVLLYTLIFEEVSFIFFLLITFILSLVLSVSTYLGIHLDSTEKWNGLLLGTAVGSFSFVALYEILWKVKGRLTTRDFLFYILVGFVIIMGYLRLFGLR
ncbi:ZIP family metal transporter (plasmid) [Alkalihalobacillus hwajinpoensis]|uniref:ZIP family metal transporter n=1 Tax=Guptibacillus hwajinpoensis TaxID=208199 RepID=UPI001883865D|nr:ZIP family metal transporter [Pseudalkalibacillus hwajinpoensis]MBF0706799.1 ZIP family metal transporter [Pseudalkalibacillus hwajinpoensis]